MDKEWIEVGLFGESIKIYKNGRRRRLVDENGRTIIEYEMD